MNIWLMNPVKFADFVLGGHSLTSIARADCYNKICDAHSRKQVDPSFRVEFMMARG